MKISDVLERTGAIRVLIIDDEAIIRNVFTKAILRMGFKAESCASAEEGFEALQNKEYQILLTDINMPGKGGDWLLAQAKAIPNSPVVFMITGQADMALAIHCLTNGAYDFLTKPIDLKLLEQKLKSALNLLEMTRERARYLELIEEMAISERWRAQKAFLSGIDALIRALEAKDEYTEGHSARVAIIAEAIAGKMNLKSSDINEVVTAARCHDIGKIGVPDAVLQKNGKLTTHEYDIIKVHPVESARILRPIFEEMPGVILGVNHHHERYDGCGYPDGLKGEEIPLVARIIGIADTYDAMTSNRIYRRAKNSKQAVDEIIACSGRQLCPKAVKGFLEFYCEIPSLVSTPDIWKNKRQISRIPLAKVVSIRFNNRELIKGTSIDISTNGLRVRVHEKVDIGEKSVVWLEGHNPQHAVVVWSKMVNDNDDNPVCEFGLYIAMPDINFSEFVNDVFKDNRERRLDRRIDRVILVNVVANTEVFRLNITNLCVGGSFIHIQKPLALNQELSILLLLGDGFDKKVEVVGKVVHCTTLSEAVRSEGSIPGMGIEFTEYLGDSRSTLEHYVFEKTNMKTYQSEVMKY